MKCEASVKRMHSNTWQRGEDRGNICVYSKRWFGQHYIKMNKLNAFVKMFHADVTCPQITLATRYGQEKCDDDDDGHVINTEQESRFIGKTNVGLMPGLSFHCSDEHEPPARPAISQTSISSLPFPPAEYCSD